MSRNLLEQLTILFLGIYCGGAALIVALLALNVSVSGVLIGLATTAFFIFAALHASASLGARHAAVFLAISFAVCLIFEFLGTSRGWIYGAYHYTNRLGPKILGLVPVLIPLAWFMMMYSSYSLANTLVFGRPGAPAKVTARRSLWLVFVSAVVMTSWDLLNDPINVAGGHWVWAEDGTYFGIPLSNYLGWMLTTLVVFALYRSVEATSKPTSAQPLRPYYALLPILAYSATLLANVAALLVTGQPGPALAGAFAMGGLAAAAISNLTRTGAAAAT